MARKFTAKSMTTESPIDVTEESVSEEATVAVSEPLPAESPVEEAKAEIPLPAKMTAMQWAGVPMWRCPRCGADTFDEKAARDHVCH